MSTQIIFYDGECGLCSRFVRFARSRDRSRRFKFAPIGGKTWQSRFDESSVAMDRGTIHLLNDQGHFTRSSAVVRVVRGFSGVWPAVAFVLWIIPKPIRDFGYRVVARIRYRLFGRTTTCPLAEEDSQKCMLP
ncbi:MAG: hypothetical protein CBC35_10275 [Planctomycetes bacterium TMED75]|nr:hypothetical protein [Planctomycetaceae bacterium]OUU91142.1 MAG: hypothetical protein CBC35_10275 [Planctomycetes bacterium TMED75]